MTDKFRRSLSFKIRASISKNEESGMRVMAVVVVSDIFVSLVTAFAGELLLIFAVCATSLADDLIFFYEADTSHLRVHLIKFYH